MKPLRIWLTFLVTCACPVLRADIIGPRPQEVAMSSGGNKIARVSVGRGDGGQWNRKDGIAIYSFKSLADRYEKIGTFDFIEWGAPHKLFVTDNGKFIVGVNIDPSPSLASIRIYDLEGKLLRRWTLPDIFSPEDVSKMPKSGATTLWVSSCGLYGDEFFWLSGPVDTQAGPRSYGVKIRFADLKLKLER